MMLEVISTDFAPDWRNHQTNIQTTYSRLYLMKKTREDVWNPHPVPRDFYGSNGMHCNFDNDDDCRIITHTIIIIMQSNAVCFGTVRSYTRSKLYP